MRFQSYFSAVVIGLTVLSSTSILPVLAQENTSVFTQEKDTSITPEKEEVGDDGDVNKLSSSDSNFFYSDEGFGEVKSIIWTGNKNFNYSISLLSAHGESVYVSFQGVRDSFLNSSGRRLTGDTTISYLFNGTKDGDTLERPWSGVRFRVCTRINLLPDSCGKWSRTYRRS